MSSSEISHSDARDLLHKLITESTNVEGVIVSSPATGFRAMTSGKLYTLPDGRVMLTGVDRFTFISFDPDLAISVRYGDDRVAEGFDNPGAELFRREFVSGLNFIFGDGSQVAIFDRKG